MNIELITKKEAESILDEFDRVQNGEKVKQREGLFLFRESGEWVAIDNSTGDAWTESFKSREIAERWLRDEIDTETAYRKDAKK